MNSFIVAKGETIIKDANLLKDPITFIRKIVELRKECDTMVLEAFNNDIKF